MSGCTLSHRVFPPWDLDLTSVCSSASINRSLGCQLVCEVTPVISNGATTQNQLSTAINKLTAQH